MEVAGDHIHSSQGKSLTLHPLMAALAAKRVSIIKSWKKGELEEFTKIFCHSGIFHAVWKL